MSEELSSEGLIGLDITAVVSDPKTKKWMKRLEKPIKAVTKIAVLEAYINRVDQDKSAGSVWNKWLKHLQVFTQATTTSADIPVTGPTIFVSNHPFGMIDGIALAAIISSTVPQTAGTSGVMEVFTALSEQPLAGSDTILLSESGLTGTINLVWGLELGGYLLLLAGIILICSYVLLRSANKSLY